MDTGRDREPPCISVVVPCYNQAHYLVEALESLVAQTYPRLDIIVIDDGSTDGTREVACRFADRVRYDRQENAGLAAARNRGLAVAEGELVTFLDADDYHDPTAIAELASAAVRHPEADVFHGGYRTVGPGRQALRSYPAAELPPDAFHALLERNRMVCHAVMVRRRTLAELGGFDERFRSLEDWECWLRLAAAGRRFVPVPAAVAVYRRYPGTLSRNLNRMAEFHDALLVKFAPIHPGCALCRRAFRRSLRNFRVDSFASILLPDARLLWRRGRRREALGLLPRAVLRDPAMLEGVFRYPLAVLTDTFHRVRSRPAGRSGSATAPRADAAP